MSYEQEFQRPSVAMVSYHNTAPFLYGLRKTGIINHIDLHLVKPSDCAAYFKSGLVDIALVPIGSLYDYSDFEVFSTHCIGAEGSVRTVCIFSQETLDRVDTVFLDSDSRTSVLLGRMLLEWKFGRKFDFIEGLPHQMDDYPNAAFLLIGDKVFDAEERFNRRWDLAEAWEEATGLPFVFAVWIRRSGSHTTFPLADFDAALAYGVNHIDDMLSESPDLTSFRDYFKENISYHFDDQKRMALLKYFVGLQKLYGWPIPDLELSKEESYAKN